MRLDQEQNPIELRSLDGDGFPSARFETTLAFSQAGTYTLRSYGCGLMDVAPADLVITAVSDGQSYLLWQTRGGKRRG